MHYRDVLEMQRSARRFKRLALWAGSLLLLIMMFGSSRWFLTGVPADPASVTMMKDYVRQAGADPDSLILSDHHGTCGIFSYIDRNGRRTAPMGFVAIPGQNVSLSLFSESRSRSRCAGPRTRLRQ